MLTSEDSVMRRWKEYFEELMNVENEREERTDRAEAVNQEVPPIARRK